jgi:mono/diheme cytochrome c family protein
MRNISGGYIQNWSRIVCLGLLLTAGCQQKMASQPSYRPLQESKFFADGQASRPLISGVVARGHLRIDAPLNTGRVAFRTPSTSNQLPQPNDDKEARALAFQQPEFVNEFPFPVTADVLEHGQHRYMIYCVVCHDAVGAGHGKIVERGYTRPPPYHIPRLREAPVGRIFAVISEGYGSMPSYAEQIPVRDRWAIVAYVKALQLSQHFPENQLTDEMRREMAASSSQEAAP